MHNLQTVTHFILTDTRGILAIVALADIITGILKAIKNKVLSSEISKWGTVTHTMIVMGFALGYSMCQEFNVSQFFEPFMWVMIFTYLLSILENVGEMGAPLPNSLINMVEVLKNMNDKQIDDDQKFVGEKIVNQKLLDEKIVKQEEEK